MARSELPVHEWLVIAVVMGLILFLGIVTRLHNHQEDASIPISKPHNTITVSIDGAVSNPGTFTLEKGATFHDLMKAAQPTILASTKDINSKKRLNDGESFHMSEKQKIKVYLEGAVRTKGAFYLPKDARYRDLPKFIPLNDNADISAFVENVNKIKEGEVIVIPEKKT